MIFSIVSFSAAMTVGANSGDRPGKRRTERPTTIAIAQFFVAINVLLIALEVLGLKA
jgi:hypothetical protein